MMNTVGSDGGRTRQQLIVQNPAAAHRMYVHNFSLQSLAAAHCTEPGSSSPCMEPVWSPAAVHYMESDGVKLSKEVHMCTLMKL